MSQPVQTCELCGRTQVVRQDGRGFPPDIAKRRLARICKASGCPSKPRYTAGFAFGGPIQGMTTTPRPTEPRAESAETDEETD